MNVRFAAATPSDAGLLRFMPFGTFAFLLLTGATVWSAPADSDDEDSLPARLPGLVATYSHADCHIEFNRYEAIPACELAAGESPDPRLPATGWRVHYRGVIDVFQPGKYQFSAAATGHVALSIDDRPIALPITDETQDTTATATPVELALGLHRVDVQYQPTPDQPARLKLTWQSESFTAEPLPSRVLGHEKSDPAVDDLFQRGRLVAEEHSCVACHLPNEKTPLSLQLAKRPGPHLTGAGARLKAGWIYHWLADPTALRPEAVMPRLFSADVQGDVQRYAVATFLAAEGGPLAIVPSPPDEVVRETADAGAQQFQKLGCAVCHERQGDRPARVTLRSLSQKTTPEVIEAFLHKPDAIAPAGLMPRFVLSKLDKRQLAMYLIGHDAATAPALELPAAPAADAVQAAFAALGLPETERTAFAARPTQQQLPALAREVMRARNCAACHEMKPQGEDQPWQPKASRMDFLAVATQPAGGCLVAPQADANGVTPPKSDGTAVPRFGTALDRQAIVALMQEAVKAPAPPAPADAARRTLARFNCQACHERDGAGGITQEFINRLGAGQDGGSELVTPPSLTQVTAKLTGKALRGVLEGDERSRPWMSLQMPHFDKKLISSLPSHLAALDAQPLAEPAAAVAAEKAADNPADIALAEAGRTLVGSRGFGCTKCHDMLDIPSAGTRGPDLANVTARINHGWYERWMQDPQRIAAGTRMPTVFLNGESPYKDILDGDPARQRAAIWQYLAVARSLPPPEGLEQQKLQTLAAGKRPVAIRTFLPGTTPRSIAVRFPNDVHAAFDAQMGRLAFAWSGEFLDMGPVWNGRGGHPAHVLGTTFWTAPAGCPWEVTATGSVVPNFAGRDTDPALGVMVRDGKLHPSRLTLLGYQVDDRGPTFRYRLALDGGGDATFAERITSLRSAAGVGVLREVAIAAPSNDLVWLHVADAETEPQITASSTDDFVPVGDQHPAANGFLRIDQGGQPLLLRLHPTGNAADWLIQRQGERWQVLVRIAAPAAGDERYVTMTLWRPTDAQPETWRQLLAEELK
jgi:mono/diheme cytochrome c family protein